MIRYLILAIAMLIVGREAVHAGTALSGTGRTTSRSDTPAVDTATSYPFGRFRAMGGIIAHDVTERDFPWLPLVNLDCRWSTATRLGEPVLVAGLGSELGLNFVLPYIKVGPELWFGSAWLSTYCGLTLYPLSVGGLLTPSLLRLVGLAAGGYLAMAGTEWEFELGLESVDWTRSGAFPHLTVGIAFR